jgi:hypothetical protein
MNMKKARFFSLFSVLLSTIAVWYFYDKSMQNVDIQIFVIAVSFLVLSLMSLSYTTLKINRT